ncbi:hypothetical protein [Pacificimonas flava]|uniref:Uncharacterized protein n=1 Tax=Pacificimonas flava TaxID=1234595 RepID=M2T7D6_9SPHN|nr:hypothetical protein [Pacificimonas flava]EMD82434.1 hypothetical protein C725_2155 [Pacificimonas flava]MBB5281267.1 hypothetical protein [Pacificimonas flava]
MSYETTLAGMGICIVLILVSWAAQRRPRRDIFRVPWFPWNAVMLLSLILFVLMAANLLSVWRG